MEATKRVLVVDDNAINLMIAKKLFRKVEGVDLHTFEDAEEALSEAIANPFDVYFIDLNMPVLDGVEFAKALRKAGEPNASKPLIALSAHTKEEAQQVTGMDVFTDFVTKPLSLEVIETLI